MSGWFGGSGGSSSNTGKMNSDAVRKQQGEIRRAQRQVQRSSAELEREEKKLEAEIKKLAKQGQTQACKMLAKQLVAIRQQKTRTTAANYRIGAVGAQTKMLNANHAVAGAISSASGVMKATNDQMNPEKMAAILKQFEEENMKMDIKDELIEESLDSILGNSDDEAEQDEVVNKILDEIGIEVNQKLSSIRTPTNEIGGSSKLTDADLEALISGGSGGAKNRSALKH